MRRQQPGGYADFAPDAKGRANYSGYDLTGRLEDNVSLMKAIFEGDDTVIYRNAENKNARLKCVAVYIEGMVDTKLMSLNLIKPLMEEDVNARLANMADIEARLVTCNEVRRVAQIEDMVKAVMAGSAVLFVDGEKEALTVGVKGFATRAIDEPDSEKALVGPREGFTEALVTNLSMVRRKLQTPDLKFSISSIGTRSPARVCIGYLDSLVDKRVLEDILERLGKIEIDAALGANYIAEHIRDHRFSPFETIGTTEKPDTVAACLLEGRVAIFLDGSPTTLTAPYLFIENFQSSDDYYLNFFFANMGRFLRILGFILSVSVPAVYIALVNFHQEVIPSPLMLTIATTTAGVPFPTVFECFSLLIVFEILRETGIRSSNKIGQALSIVGGLVIGQAAVEAKIVSAPMVIVVAMTGITGLIMPKLQGAILVMRFGALTMASISGLLGFYFVWVMALIHLLSLHSFGYPYVRDFFRDDRFLSKDSFIRAPIFSMKMRPGFSRDRVRR